MTIEHFQRFIESCIPSACVPVDLVKISRNLLLSNIGPRVEHDFRYQPPEMLPSPLCLVMDGECCLDRLYGGYFGDWVCGGQWNRMLDFLRTFFETVKKNNIEVTVFFNGAFEAGKINGWAENQKLQKEKINQVLKHLTNKGTPPPKVWWVAPNGLRSCLRTLLRHLKVNVLLTTDDHEQEVMSYLIKYNYHGLLADNPEYIIFDLPRYFSSSQLKLTYKGCIETKEFILNEVTRCMNLHPSRICIVASLLGNHILNPSYLQKFHERMIKDVKGPVNSNSIIKAIIDFVRNLHSIDDLDDVALQVFGNPSNIMHEKFKECVLHYSKGSMTHSQNSKLMNQSNVSQNKTMNKSSREYLLPTPEYLSLEDINTKNLNINRPKFATETEEKENSSLQSIQKILEKAKSNLCYEVIVDQEMSDTELALDFNMCEISEDTNKHKKKSASNVLSDSDHMSSVEPFFKVNVSQSLNICESEDVPLPPEVSSEIMRVSHQRHQRGLMHPFIYQILSQAEIKLSVTFEDETSSNLPSPCLLYRPVRQMVYALLFNQHHMQFLSEEKKEKIGVEVNVPDIIVKEWVWSSSTAYDKPDIVKSTSLGWPVPTIRNLWFCSGPEYNKKRLQAFLTCMRSNIPSMGDSIIIPQHLIILCCILRYMLTSLEPFLYKHELDAFLVQAVNPHLMDTEYTQKLEIPSISPRGVMLAALFMQGVDHAILANDTCGAPVSWLMCCPWLFFDGKLFHHILFKANSAKNLLDLCDNRYEEVCAVEQMKNVICEGIQVRFLSPALLPHRQAQQGFQTFPMHHQQFSQGRGRGLQRVVPRGGQLEVAGVVVGSWGPNYGQCPRSPNHKIPPHVVSVGGIGRGRESVNYGMGRGLTVEQILEKPLDKTSVSSSGHESPKHKLDKGSIYQIFKNPKNGF